MSFKETEELLEYPEVQADKAYYLSILAKYNKLKLLNDRLKALVTAIEEERALTALIGETVSAEDRSTVYEEISALKRTELSLSAALSEALGCKRVEERAYIRIKLRQGSSKLGVALFSLIKSDMASRGAKAEEEKFVSAKGGFVREISCVFSGADALVRLMPLVGAHKVYTDTGSEELAIAVTPSFVEEEPSESDMKIDLFHSSGAGGQNVNKVETAVRVTHIPTGLVVVCQDERSQIKNKKRALETIKKRLRETRESAEKKRMESDINAQLSRKNTPIVFDASKLTMTDTRLKAYYKIPFPMTDEEFTLYINGLIAL